jgi:hypothetical protein
MKHESLKFNVMDTRSIIHVAPFLYQALPLLRFHNIHGSIEVKAYYKPDGRGFETP